MGILDDLASNALGAASGRLGLDAAQTQGLAQAVLRLVQEQHGGLAGLVQAFEQQGLGNLVTSWIGTGQNLPIGADQLRAVLGSGALAQVAQQAGLSPEQGLDALTRLLPQLVDGMTPGGQAPQGGDLLQAGLALLRRFG